MEDGHSLEKEELLDYCEGPWSLGGIEEDGVVGAHEARGGHCRGCVRMGGRVKPGPRVMDWEADARTAAVEVWFWDMNL